jgi:hypothetical protein
VVVAGHELVAGVTGASVGVVTGRNRRGVQARVLRAQLRCPVGGIWLRVMVVMALVHHIDLTVIRVRK